MIVADLVADLLADDPPQEINGVIKNRPESPTNRPAEIVAALGESPQSPESPGASAKNEGSMTYGYPLAALYRAWLSGIDEPMVLLTLNDAQVREAVTQGVVSRGLARANVLLLLRVPGGETNPGAVGLLAIPRDLYAGFSPINALEALAWKH